LYQREKFEYENNQTQEYNTTIITSMINSFAFFIAHTKENAQQYKNTRQYKREIDYILTHQSYKHTSQSRQSLQKKRDAFLLESNTPPLYLIDNMKKLSALLENPIKIQRNINQNKDISYNIAPAVRYIDFAEYLRMFNNHKVLFFSATRPEYTRFLNIDTLQQRIPITHEENNNRIISLIQKTTGSIFVVSHNTEKSKKLFASLHEQ
jgi:hypothetical protein